MKRIIVAITGATGAPLAVKLLQYLHQQPEIEVHLVISHWAKITLQQETNLQYQQLYDLADMVHDVKNLGASISSGSFRVEGMIIVPCSMKTLASIRCGLSDNLISRAADVILKEQKKLVLVTRETPLSAIHLENMLQLAKMGCVILPPIMGFYYSPTSINDMVEHTVMRILDQFDLGVDLHQRWQGLSSH